MTFLARNWFCVIRFKSLLPQLSLRSKLWLNASLFLSLDFFICKTWIIKSTRQNCFEMQWYNTNRSISSNVTQGPQQACESGSVAPQPTPLRCGSTWLWHRFSYQTVAMTSHTLLHLSNPQFPYWKNGDGNSASFRMCLWGITECYPENNENSAWHTVSAQWLLAWITTIIIYKIWNLIDGGNIAFEILKN